ncbi:MAG: S8 family serine peptidase, partial [Desulfobulbaceae bacterium]|nr:S8 family serine peptidase [Desulfobulbaceae bacterium]
GVAIAICDTGIDYTHPRLGGGGFPNAKVIGGYDTGQEDTNPMDANGHGTACAGIAAGDLGTTADYIGGVAYSAKLYALKITDSETGGSAWTSDIIQAWEWAITHQFDDPANPIMIISTSFGGGRYLTNCDNSEASLAIAAANTNVAGISIFVSAGNEGYCDAMGSPACVSQVISVGAVYDAAFGMYYPCVNALSCVTKTAHTGCATGYYAQDNTAADKITSYSNTAAFLTLLAPSNQSYTTDITGTAGYSTNSYYSSFGGTSAAAPYAAGAGALLQSAIKATSGSFLSTEALKNRLVTSGDLIADPKAVNRTTPRINLQNAFSVNLDSDGDGVPDLLDAFPNNPNETADSDGDGVGDNADLCPNGNDTIDTDGDLVPDACDALPTVAGEWADTDGDGVGDNMDNCVQVANADQLDADNDARGNACDPSIDDANYGSVLGAPHNETRGIHCNTCHTYSLWWKYSPLNVGDPIYQAMNNTMCTNCHGTHGPGQQIKAVHSSDAMGMQHRVGLGPWTVKCIDCHAPHNQAQLDWRAENASELYLATGTITGNVAVHGGQTTFTYTISTIAPEWSNRASWSRKNDLPPASGLILVEDTGQARNTFEVIAADATTITVKGGLDPAATGSPFGIIYGQAIKSHIQTPSSGSREVKFFNPLDPAGGFTDQHDPVTGICQVCHANTLYWNATGTVFDDLSHSGSGLTKCTNCHVPSLGFKPLR